MGFALNVDEKRLRILENAKKALNTLYDSLMKRSAEGKKVHKTPGTEH